MKVLKTKPIDDYILIDNVTTNHLVVAVIITTSGEKIPTVLGKGYEEKLNDLSFFVLGSNNPKNRDNIITVGNGYEITKKEDTPSKMIKGLLDTFPNSKVEVFEKTDWKNALQFLIDNA